MKNWFKAIFITLCIFTIITAYFTLFFMFPVVIGVITFTVLIGVLVTCIKSMLDDM